MGLLLSVLIFLLMLTVFCEMVSGARKLGSLGDTEQWAGASGPRVSIIVPARNEARKIGRALRSLCLQNYPHLEIIVVNDRSTDATAQIVEELQRKYPRLSLVNIKTLPAGWMGKAHALQIGAEAARGDYLLFTDADVSLQDSTVSRAVSHLQSNNLDHLTLIFRNRGGGHLLNALITDAGAALVLLFKPWKAEDPRSRFFVGVGAFNMVRRSVYQAIGGHQSIRMQAIDDIFLGKRIKEKGFHQSCLFGQEYVEVPWYSSVREMVSGLMKNIYALFHYRAGFALLAVLLIIAATIVPVWGAIFTCGAPRLFFLAAVLVRFAGIGAIMLKNGSSIFGLPLLLLTPYISIYIIARAVWTTERAGGITWRSSFYSLDELRKSEWLLKGLYRFRAGGREN